MLNKLKSKSEFSKNVLTLMTGTTIAQAIPIAISPILTRLYTPEDFGVFALFIAIVSIFGSIANGRYELAIMLPKKDEDAINIFALGFIINVALSLFLLFIVLIFHDKIVELLNNKEISPWIYFVPFSVFLVGCFNLLNYFNNRLKNYKDLAKANVYKSIGGAIVQLSLGFLKAGVLGLISGQIFSQLVSNFKLFLNIKKRNLFKYIRKVKIVALGIRYKEFAIYSSGGAFLGTVLSNFHLFFIEHIFSSFVIGLIFLSQKFIAMPLNLISSSFSQVYFKKISDINDLIILKRSYINSIKKLSLISVFIIIFFLIIPNSFYSFILGNEWSELGNVIKILIFWYGVSFVASSVSFIYTRLEKQKEMFYFDVFHLILLTFTFLIVIYFKFSLYISLIFYVSIKIFVYLLAIILAVRFLNVEISQKN